MFNINSLAEENVSLENDLLETVLVPETSNDLVEFGLSSEELALANDLFRSLSDESTREQHNLNPNGLREQLKHWSNGNMPGASGDQNILSFNLSTPSAIPALQKEPENRLSPLSKVTDNRTFSNHLPSIYLPWSRPNIRRTATEADFQSDHNDQNMYALPDPNQADAQSGDDSNQKKYCLVCEDAASGYHYGMSKVANITHGD